MSDNMMMQEVIDEAREETVKEMMQDKNLSGKGWEEILKQIDALSRVFIEKEKEEVKDTPSKRKEINDVYWQHIQHITQIRDTGVEGIEKIRDVKCRDVQRISELTIDEIKRDAAKAIDSIILDYSKAYDKAKEVKRQALEKLDV